MAFLEELMLQEEESDYWKAMAVSSAAMYIYEEAKSDYRVSKDKFKRAENAMLLAKDLFDKQKAKSVVSKPSPT